MLRDKAIPLYYQLETIIRKKIASGDFPPDKPAILELPKFSGSIEDLILMGIQTQVEVLDICWIEAPETIKERLDFRDKEKVLRIEKLRTIERTPFSHVYNYLPPDIGRRLPTDLVTSKPMLMILEDELGIRANAADQSVEATIADAQQASILEIRVGDPLLKAERTVYDYKNQPVEYVVVVYRADKYAFTMKLKRKRTKKSAGWDAYNMRPY